MLAMLVLATGCTVTSVPSSTSTSATPPAPAASTTEYVGPGSVGGAFPVLTQLAQPKVAALDPNRPAYNREDWDGKGWGDADGDGCNTRAEVLKAESSVPTTSKSKTNCTILTGSWRDPYTGQTFTDAAALQIDHLVALGDASASGGWAWSPARKAAFANDLDDPWQLNAVAGAENERKADYGPDRWTPPSLSFRCGYVAAYAGIKARWGLTVTPQQWAAIQQVWSHCGAK